MKSLSFTLLFLFCTTFLYAQNTGQEILLKQVSENGNSALNALSEEQLYGLFSNSNFLAGLQRAAMDASQVARINMMGDGNEALLTQLGVYNIGIIGIVGDSNNATLLQEGDRLLSIMNIRGDSNTMDVEQNGFGLQNYIDVTGSGLSFDILQNKNGVQFSQTGANTIPLQVTRTGRSIPIIIRNN